MAKIYSSFLSTQLFTMGGGGGAQCTFEIFIKFQGLNNVHLIKILSKLYTNTKLYHPSSLNLSSALASPWKKVLC